MWGFLADRTYTVALMLQCCVRLPSVTCLCIVAILCDLPKTRSQAVARIRAVASVKEARWHDQVERRRRECRGAAGAEGGGVFYISM